MSELRIELREDRSSYEPGEELMGTAVWQLSQVPRLVELRLFWFTRGKGTEDAGVIATTVFDRPVAEETRAFRFRLPEGPYSFSGKLISLIWALELVVQPTKQVVRREIILALDGEEIRLDTLPGNEKSKRLFPWNAR
jgi:hypothetical protein